MKFLRISFMEAVLVIGAVVDRVTALRTDYDPLNQNDFCRRHSHATAQIKDRLYIDGGYINTKPNDLKNFTMNHLLYLDLNNDLEGLPPLAGPLSKPSIVPRVVGGQLWADEANGRLFMFGGEFPADEPVLPVPRGMWTYDAWENEWSLLPESKSTTSHDLTRPSFGAGAVLEHEGRAYYMGGWVGKQNVPGWTGPRMALPGIFIYDMVGNTWRNETGPTNLRPLPRVEGVLLFVPAGDRGLLVSFGGVYAHPNGTVEPAPMSDIDIYDLAGGYWYTQKATGAIPETRRLFCAGVGTAFDSSSHNVYLYGGAATENNNRGYGDVYILTMPSFRWIKWYPASDKDQTAPHNSLSCNVVRSYQMIIMGGYFPDQSTCDVPAGFGVHNLDMSAYNKGSNVWYGYNKTEKTYLVPRAVINIVGGDPNGDAVVRTPANAGFSDPALKILFTRAYTPYPRVPTRTPPADAKAKRKKLIPIVVPIAVGVIILLAILVGFLVIYRRKKQREQLLANPIGGGGNPAYPYMNGVGGPAMVGPIDHVTAFQLPTTQSPAVRASQFPPPHSESAVTPGRSPFYQPDGGSTPYAQYTGHSFIELASPDGPTQFASLPPQELPAEYYTPTDRQAEKKGKIQDGMILPSVELPGDTAGLGLAIAGDLRSHKPEERYIKPLSKERKEQQNGPVTHVGIPAPENFIRHSMGPIVPLGAPPPPRKSNLSKALPPVPPIPEDIANNSTIFGSNKPERNSTEHYPLPSTPSRNLSRRSKRRTREERDMLASGPYYPPTPSNDTDSLISMPTPTCEIAGFAKVVSPAAVVATNRVSVQRLSRTRSGKQDVEWPQPPPVPVPVRTLAPAERYSLEEGPWVRYDSEGVQMV